MRVLLDTSVAIWLDADPAQLSTKARDLIEDSNVECMVSVISIWEIEVKHQTGKLPMSTSVRESVDQLIRTYDVKLLDLRREACHLLSRLQLLHRDPFDRLLMCQALSEGVPLVSPDSVFERYPVGVIW